MISLISVFNVFLEKLVGNKCLFDEECYGTNTVCKDGRCSCPTNFVSPILLYSKSIKNEILQEEYDMDDQKRICRLAPSKIGESCQRDCKPPLLCRDGKCECWGGSVHNGTCTVRKFYWFVLFGNTLNKPPTFLSLSSRSTTLWS